MKSIFKSKTAAVAFVTATAGFWPSAREWVGENPQAALTAVATISLVLRLVTKDKVVLFTD